mgnify:CR=1 FL=1
MNGVKQGLPLSKLFRKLDLYRKLTEDVFDTDIITGSKTGVLLSVATCIILLSLFVLEFLDFLVPDTRYNYNVAQSEYSTMGVLFAINFTSIPCSALHIDYANIYGAFSLNATSGSVNHIRITKQSYFNRRHGKQISPSFVDPEFGEDADEKWNCDSDYLTNPNSLKPCINRGMFTTLLFITHDCSPKCKKFATEYQLAIQHPGSSVAETAESTTNAATTTLDHRRSVARSVLLIDCKDSAMRDVCVWHGITFVPSFYTYFAGSKVASGVISIPETNNVSQLVHRHVHDELADPGAQCLGWRQTGECNPLGPREPWRDLACTAIVPQGSSGYCECVGRTQANLLTCTHAGDFTCQDVCRTSTGDKTNTSANTTAQRGDTVGDLLMHEAEEVERREQNRLNGPSREIVTPLDVISAIDEFVGSGCVVKGRGELDIAPGSLVFSVEVRSRSCLFALVFAFFRELTLWPICGCVQLPHALAFPASVVDWSHSIQYFMFTHGRDPSVSDHSFDSGIIDLYNQVCSSNVVAFRDGRSLSLLLCPEKGWARSEPFKRPCILISRLLHWV